MPDEAPVTGNTPPPCHDDRTRRLIVWLSFIQFNLFIVGAGAMLATYGWKLPPEVSNVMMIVLTAEVGLITTITGFYFGYAYGQKHQAEQNGNKQST